MDADRFAAQLPIAHSVPNHRLAQHRPGEALPPTPNNDGFGDGACLYLGPLRRRYREPSLFPILGYLFRPECEGAAWWGAPCDVGGFVNWAEDRGKSPGEICTALSEIKLTNRSWREYAARLVREGFGGEGAKYVSADAQPGRDAVHPVIREHLTPSDPLTWTPEVRCPTALPIERSTVSRAFRLWPGPRERANLDDAASRALTETENSLTFRGVPVEPVSTRGAELAEQALLRVSAAWIIENCSK